jgi:hypothetical protein
MRRDVLKLVSDLTDCLPEPCSNNTDKNYPKYELNLRLFFHDGCTKQMEKDIITSMMKLGVSQMSMGENYEN